MNDFDFMNQMNLQNQMEATRMELERTNEAMRHTREEGERLNQQMIQEMIQEMIRNGQLLSEEQMRRYSEEYGALGILDLQRQLWLLRLRKMAVEKVKDTFLRIWSRITKG